MSQATVEVVCGVIEQDGRILACLRSPEKHLGNLWEFPGGKVDDGESRASALQRELVEELGIHVTITGSLRPVLWNYGDITIHLHPFLCEIESGLPTPTEHSEIRWCEPQDLPSLEWAAADIPIYREWLEIHRRTSRDS